ncbi:hypothetical protein HPB50_004537 [Hyalomma asiaticum]|uniref:Uncharacterized protein n=1 Tax=Hyalomma asiaticum TaxID=266040 RepID=A0ACB7S0Q5_HYAAI|nr:hypothetical protein HPB50_004537 [Hyalomma asiaticum]
MNGIRRGNHVWRSRADTASGYVWAHRKAPTALARPQEEAEAVSAAGAAARRLASGAIHAAIVSCSSVHRWEEPDSGIESCCERLINIFFYRPMV